VKPGLYVAAMKTPSSLICSHRYFTHIWPFVADELHRLWQARPGEAVHLVDPSESPSNVSSLADEEGVALENVERLASLAVDVTPADLERMPKLRQLSYRMSYWEGSSDELKASCEARGIDRIEIGSQAYWGQSVAEVGLALTLCALRQIPQKHASIITSQDAWGLDLLKPLPGSDAGGHQFGDSDRFVGGTLQGKRVRVVGMGNIGGRYAKFCRDLGADVAAWDPFAPEASFDLVGVRRVHTLEALADDAEIFAPMIPHTKATAGLVSKEILDLVPTGSILVVVTRMGVCDEPAVRRRVLADELMLAADVFDPNEPLKVGDELLGRANVIHTPHIAGRTRDANLAWARLLDARFTK
jgi:phosphoglycerate dehydrogenase-like enzyme